MMGNNYLSDEELAALMAEVEDEGLVKAPDRIEKNVLKQIHLQKKKVTDFRLYCLQVGLSVAAAIVILFVGPFNPFMKPEIPSKEVVTQSKEVVTREEALAGKEVRSKEEVMADEGVKGKLSNVQKYVEDKIQEYIG